MISKFITPILLVTMAAFLQQTNFLLIYNVKPNLVLVIIIVMAFFIEFLWYYLLLMLIGLSLIRTSPGFEKEIIVLGFLLLVIFPTKKILPWKPQISIALLTIIATILFYLFSSENIIIKSPALAVTEIFYNVIFGLIIYLSYYVYNGRQEKFFINYEISASKRF